MPKKDKASNHLLPVKSIMTKNVVTVKPDTLIFDAMRLFPRHNVSGLPVVDNDLRLVGIITEKDVLDILTKEEINYEDTVSEYMKTEVIAFNEDDSANSICKFFQTHHIRRVPIVKDGKLIGIVARRDIISLILEAKSNLASYRFS